MPKISEVIQIELPFLVNPLDPYRWRVFFFFGRLPSSSSSHLFQNAVMESGSILGPLPSLALLLSLLLSFPPLSLLPSSLLSPLSLLFLTGS
jgi:hypothetical protein